MKKLIIVLSIALMALTAYGAVTVTVNGSNYTIPQTNEKGWGTNVTTWIQAISGATLQKSGGTFSLTADTDFGASFGLKSNYFKSRSSNISSSGVLRLSNTDAIGFRNSLNSGDLSLTPGASDGILNYNSVPLVGTSLTQTLTNKTIDATTNTISNIANSNISSSAAIGLSKLAPLTVSKALVSDVSGVISASSTSSAQLGYLSGVTSDIQTQINSKADSSTAVTLTGSQTLTNKTLTSPILTTPSIDVTSLTDQGSTPATPSSGVTKIYTKTDGNLYKLTSSGTESTVGSGSGTGVNFVGLNTSWILSSSTDIDAESSVGNWAAYADAAGPDPVDMTGGAPNVACTRTNNPGNVINGSASFSMVFDAANRQGQGCSLLVNIPKAYRGQNAQIQIPFYVATGSIACSSATACDIMIKAYDVTNNALIPVSNGQVSGTGLLRANLVIPSTAAQVRIGFHRASTAATAVTANFDDVIFGPPSNIGETSQSTLVGSAYFPATASCIWGRTSTTLGSFGTTAACPGPTVENQFVGSWQTTDTDLPKITVNNLPAGRYRVTVNGLVYGNNAAYAYLSTAINDGTTTSGYAQAYANASTSGINFTSVGVFEYTSAGNRTFELYGSASANGIQVDNSVGNARLTFTVERFPLATESAYRPDQVANSWSGYHDSDCTWSTTSASFVDPTDDATCTFTERVNKNFGTVTSVSSKGPGIVFTPSRLGTYRVCAKVNFGESSGAGAARIQLVDGSSTVVGTGEWFTGSTGSATIPVCGNYNATSSSATTLKLQIKTSSGTATINNLGSMPAIEWEISQIDQGSPAPYIIGSIVNPSSGVEQMLRARISNTANPCSITSQSGAALSLGSASGTAGICNLNIAAGTFSAVPTCVCTAEQSAVNTPTCSVDSSTLTSTFVKVFTGSGSAGTVNGYNFSLICMGPK